MSYPEITRSFAAIKHSGQIYRGFNGFPDEPYINHIDRVAAHFPFTAQLQTIAYLHDILEDTNCTVEELVELGMAQSEIHAIRLLTKSAIIDAPGEIDLYYTLIKSDKIARQVKLADLSDNLSQSVKKGMTDKARNYAKWIEYLTTETA